MSIDETGWLRALSEILMWTPSGHGYLAAAIRLRRRPDIRFGPYRGDDVPAEVWIILGLALSFLAYLIFLRG